MNVDIAALRHPKEKIYGTIMVVAGILLWAVFALFLIATMLASPNALTTILTLISYILIFWLISLIARALTRAYMYGHYVMIGDDQFPHLHRMVLEGSKALGLKAAPVTFVFNSHGLMNAMALRLVGRRRYIWLTSALIDADNDEQVRFVIGHELGHHAAGHLDAFKRLVKLPAHIIPFLGAAYSRGRELTCDRVGAALAGNLSQSRSALQMLACGSARLNSAMNPQAFQAQEQQVPEFTGWLLHIFSHYPRLTRRVEAITEWWEQGRLGDRSVFPADGRYAPKLAEN